MVDRLLVWFGAGVVAVGVTAGMVTGTALAAADDGSNSDGGGSTSESSNSTAGGEGSSGAGGAPGGDTSPGGVGGDDTEGPVTTDPDDTESGETHDDTGSDDDGTTDDDATDEGDTTDEGDVDVDDVKTDEDADADVTTDEDAKIDEAVTTDDTQTAEGVTSNSGSDATNGSRAATETWKPSVQADENASPEAGSEGKAAVEQVDTGTTEVVDDTVVRTSVPLASVAAEAEESPEVQAVAFASAAPEVGANAAATAPPLTALLDLVGTIVFNLYAVATRLVGGPPILPPNSSVTVRSSTLVLECGCNEGDTIEVPADWYIPEVEEGEDPPDRLIYLQHGFLASGPWYSHTAAALAEQTNSIVVAPSITSNFLAADACWLGAPPMHQAMADLFDDDNTALADSALAAGYSGAIPDRVVLMGHSLGGGAVSGVAGYMVDNNTIDRLAGVVLLDGVGLDDPNKMLESLTKVPDEIPIYQLAAPVYFWNSFGVGIDALVEARPGTFVGVTLVGGSHVDSMRGGNPLIQFSQQLVSGFSKPQNVAAAQILMVGWVNDMFAGNQATGIYLDPSEEFVLDTPSGEATLVALPNSLTKPFPLNFLRQFMSFRDGLFTFEPTCVAESVGAAAADSCQGSLAA